jgi:hypothetical protein
MEANTRLAHSTVFKDLLEDYERRLKENNSNWEERVRLVQRQSEEEKENLRKGWETREKAVRREMAFLRERDTKMMGEKLFEVRLLLEVELQKN